MTLIILIVIGVICLAIGANRRDSGGKNSSSSACRCPNCGASLRPGAHECGWCGDYW